MAGRPRGLSQIMPAFGDLLTDEQINDVIAYMRGFLQECFITIRWVSLKPAAVRL